VCGDPEDDIEDIGCPDWLDPRENYAALKEIESYREHFVEVPNPDHGDRHVFFKRYLKRIGRKEEYSGSIGRWLKESGEDEDKHAWAEHLREELTNYVKTVVEAAGLKVVVR
jgi:hypothetical protein